jgi:hypothetical protein
VNALRLLAGVDEAPASTEGFHGRPPAFVGNIPAA